MILEGCRAVAPPTSVSKVKVEGLELEACPPLPKSQIFRIISSPTLPGPLSGSLGHLFFKPAFHCPSSLEVSRVTTFAQPETRGWGSDHRVSIFIIAYNLKQLLLPPPTPGKAHPNSPLILEPWPDALLCTWPFRAAKKPQPFCVSLMVLIPALALPPPVC